MSLKSDFYLFIQDSISNERNQLSLLTVKHLKPLTKKLKLEITYTNSVQMKMSEYMTQ